MSGVTVENQHPTLRVHQRDLARHLRQVLVKCERPGAWIDVSLVDDLTIRELNRQWRGRDEVTDVLSFAVEDDLDGVIAVPMLGDVVISLDTAARQAAEMSAMLCTAELSYRLRDEVFFLATHGALHLLGYDHQHPEEAETMEALERRLVAGFTSAPVHALDRSRHGLALQ